MLPVPPDNFSKLTVPSQVDDAFTTIAARTGLGRTTLYRDPTLRAVIEEHRHRAATSGTLTGLTNEIATLRAHRIPARISELSDLAA
jgi:hypothetical protein